MPNTVEMFAANLGHAIRHNETGTVGGGSFTTSELSAVLAALNAGVVAARDLEVLTATNATNASARASLAAELDEWRETTGRLEDECEGLRGALERETARVDQLLAAMAGRVPTPPMAPRLPELVANTTRACYWFVRGASHNWYVATGADVTREDVRGDGGYMRLDSLMSLKGEGAETIRANCDPVTGRHK